MANDRHQPPAIVNSSAWTLVKEQSRWTHWNGWHMDSRKLGILHRVPKPCVDDTRVLWVYGSSLPPSEDCRIKSTKRPSSTAWHRSLLDKLPTPLPPACLPHARGPLESHMHSRGTPGRNVRVGLVTSIWSFSDCQSLHSVKFFNFEARMNFPRHRCNSAFVIGKRLSVTWQNLRCRKWSHISNQHGPTYLKISLAAKGSARELHVGTLIWLLNPQKVRIMPTIYIIYIPYLQQNHWSPWGFASLNS